GLRAHRGVAQIGHLGFPSNGCAALRRVCPLAIAGER
ncbi:MAG: hypothetical protein ACI9AX_000544, partial [Polaromonas sp.]